MVITSARKRRSSRSQILYNIGVVLNFVKFTGKQLCRRSWAANFIKKDTPAHAFLWILENISGDSLYRTPPAAYFCPSSWPSKSQKMFVLLWSIEHSKGIDKLCRKLLPMLSDAQVQVQLIVPFLSEATVYSVLFKIGVQKFCKIHRKVSVVESLFN